MCFYHDYDWTASETNKLSLESDGTVRCGECRRTITNGERFLRIEMFEHEQCLDCGKHHSDDACDECDPGEHFTWDMCHQCELLRAAIVRCEKAEGCDGDEASPPLDLIEEFGNWDKDARQKAFGRYFAECDSSLSADDAASVRTIWEPILADW